MIIEEKKLMTVDRYESSNIPEFINYQKMMGIPKVQKFDDNTFVFDCLHHNGDLRIRFVLSNLDKDEKILIQNYYDEIKNR